jgi:hypothetical protein
MAHPQWWLVIAVAVTACRFDATGLATETRDSEPAVAPDTFTPLAVRLPVSTTPDADAPIDCAEPGAIVAGDHCYFSPDGAFDWYGARDACIAHRAHLVTIVDATELALMTTLATGDRWMGLRKAGDAGVFAWITGEPFAFDAFAPGEPNGTGSCGKTSPTGEWRDYSCLEALPAICERE